MPFPRTRWTTAAALALAVTSSANAALPDSTVNDPVAPDKAARARAEQAARSKLRFAPDRPLHISRRELIDRWRSCTRTEGRIDVCDFVEGWYDTRCRHTAIGYESPAAFEQRHLRTAS